MEAPLINIDEIRKYKQISGSIETDVINQYILEAQIQDLAPLLGESLYNAIIETPEDFETLLNGNKYVYDDKKYTNYGLNAVLAHYAYARYVRFGSYIDTPFSFVEKKNDTSDRVSESGKTNLYNLNRDTAFNYFKNVLLYMQRKGYVKDTCKPKKSNFRYNNIKMGR